MKAIGFSFLLVFIFLISCGKDEKERPVAFFSGQINTESFSWREGEGGWLSQPAWGFGNDCSATGILVYQQGGMSDENSGRQMFFALSGCIDLENNPGLAALSMIKVGNFPFGAVIYEPGVVQVVYQDSMGTSWRSYTGTANQEGSTFSISKVEPSNDSQALYLVTGSFSCKLFNNEGDSLMLDQVAFTSLIGITSSFK